MLTCCLLIGLFCLRIPLIRDRYFDPDELEHLQVSFLISRGWVPHKDFFEHHNHLLHFILLPFIRPEDPAGSLYSARLLMQVLTAGIIALTWLLGRRLYSRAVGGAAAVWLSCNYIFLVKTLEIRPDTPALLFMLAAVILFLSAIRDRRNGLWFAAGFSAALSLLCTLKMVFPLLGILIYLAIFWLREGLCKRGETRTVLREIISAAAGSVLPNVIYFLYFSRHEALPGLIKETILLNLAWQVRFSPLLYLRQFSLFNPCFVFWSCVGIIGAPFINRRWRNRPPGTFLPYCALIGGVAGTVINPVPYAQYFALLLPLAAIFASLAIIRFLHFLRTTPFMIRVTAGLVLILPIILPVYIRYIAGYRYDLILEDIGFWIIITGAALVGGYIFALLPLRRIGKWGIVTALLAAVVIRPINLIMHSYRYTNHTELELLRTVHEGSGTEGRVFDGWTGLGLFRFPAYYYMLLHHEILSILSSEEKGPALLRVLKENPPAIVIKDDAFYQLSTEIGGFVEENYRVIAAESLRGIPVRIYQLKH